MIDTYKAESVLLAGCTRLKFQCDDLAPFCRAFIAAVTATQGRSGLAWLVHVEKATGNQ